MADLNCCPPQNETSHPDCGCWRLHGVYLDSARRTGNWEKEKSRMTQEYSMRKMQQTDWLTDWLLFCMGSVILPIVLYGCETWEELRLRVFENRLLRRMLEEDRSWRKLHNDELHSLYSSLNIVRVIKSRRMRWAGHVAGMGEGRGVRCLQGFGWEARR
jgi:hypothetical protein